jgi:chromosome segregation ATPase
MSSVIPTKNLEEMSREELIALVNFLVHQQFQLNMQVASLQNGLAEKDKRLEDRESYIKILETQVLEMNELRALVNKLQAENISLTKLTQELQREVSDLTYQVSDLKSQFHLQQAELESIKLPLTARHFADQAEKRATSIAFPKASNSNCVFSIRSFGNQVSFIDDPEKAEHNEQCFVGKGRRSGEHQISS